MEATKKVTGKSVKKWLGNNAIIVLMLAVSLIVGIIHPNFSDEVRRMKRSDCLVMISGEAPVRDKKYNLFDHPNLKYTPDYRSPRGLLHRAATPIPAPEGYTMPPDYMAQAGTVSLAYVAELTCPEITEDLYDELQEWEESLL